MRWEGMNSIYVSGLMGFWTSPSCSILNKNKEHNASETVRISEMLCFYLSLEYRTMEKAQKPISSNCHASSSAPFKIYSIYMA
jgi:hypothetical protein